MEAIIRRPHPEHLLSDVPPDYHSNPERAADETADADADPAGCGAEEARTPSKTGSGAGRPTDDADIRHQVVDAVKAGPQVLEVRPCLVAALEGQGSGIGWCHIQRWPEPCYPLASISVG
ncbi:hypothetical protein [Streptomyces parvulus]|uniref:hypothetical protein n=1 Tax=Streptomyces parvulus TaxID=146923 RepID=UPI0036E3A8D1